MATGLLAARGTGSTVSQLDGLHDTTVKLVRQTCDGRIDGYGMCSECGADADPATSVVLKQRAELVRYSPRNKLIPVSMQASSLIVTCPKNLHTRSLSIVLIWSVSATESLDRLL